MRVVDLPVGSAGSAFGPWTRSTAESIFWRHFVKRNEGYFLFSYLERQTNLTSNQRKIILAAMIGDMLEFLDYFLISFVVAFIGGPWKLTFGKSAVVLLASGVGAMFGAVFYGRLADKIGRRKVFMLTVVNFSLATGALAFTPENGWLFLSLFRFITGFGTGGLYCVDLPLVQEFVPSSKRGMVGGLVTASVPLGILIGSAMGAFLTPVVGWRGLFAIGVLPGIFTLLIRTWVPESPLWLMRMGRNEEARKSLAWALEVNPSDLPLPEESVALHPEGLRDLFRYPRSLIVSWLTNLTAQTGYYGFLLWAPTLLVLLLRVSPGRAAFLMIFVSLAGIVGKVTMSFLSDAIGRRASGGLVGLGAAATLVCAAVWRNGYVDAIPLFWVLLIVANFFVEGTFAIVGPYSAEVWPADLRTTGMGSAYGFGGLGKVMGPLGLALIVGSANVVTPQASTGAIIPAFVYLGSCYALAGIIFLCFGIETNRRSLEAIDAGLKPVG
jgi:MFS transporter, putative metabolite:H+ symporter